jgi:hypothetical protein
MAGRTTKYSPKLIDKLLGYIEDGLNNKQACQAVGIGETTLREWRNEHEGLAERIEAAREVMRSKVLAKIKEAGAKDWRAWVEFLRLSFAEYRFGNGPSVNVAIQQNMALSDPERAKLIAQREHALANRPEPLQLADASDAREIALEAEDGEYGKGKATKCATLSLSAYEQPPKTVVERADLLEERQQWRAAARRDEVAELLGD